jgi:hypothetical protein
MGAAIRISSEMVFIEIEGMGFGTTSLQTAHQIFCRAAMCKWMRIAKSTFYLCVIPVLQEQILAGFSPRNVLIAASANHRQRLS